MSQIVNPHLEVSVPPPPSTPPAVPAAPRPARIDYTALRPEYHLPPKFLACTAVFLAALAGLYYWTLWRMWDRWQAPAGYYSHGPLVLPIALVTAWLIIRQRGLPMRSTPASRSVGLTLIIGSVLVHLACMYARVTFLSGFTLLGTLGGAVLYLGGRAMLSRLWFPIAFLAFMVPLPDVTVGAINFRLKMDAAILSTAIVNMLGIPAILQGSDIVLEAGKRLTVEDACSGLKSLISLLAFATLFTYACKLRGYKRLLLFLSAVPIAILANVVRISVLTVVANNYDLRLSMPGGWVHDTMGFVVFVIAFSMMFMEEEFLDLLPGARSAAWILQKPPSPSPPTPAKG